MRRNRIQSFQSSQKNNPLLDLARLPPISSFVNQSYALQSYLPRALTAGLPTYAIQIAAGMFQFGFQGVPPSAPLPNFQGIMNSNRDSELTSAQCANKLVKNGIKTINELRKRIYFLLSSLPSY